MISNFASLNVSPNSIAWDIHLPLRLFHVNICYKYPTGHIQYDFCAAYLLPSIPFCHLLRSNIWVLSLTLSFFLYPVLGKSSHLHFKTYIGNDFSSHCLIAIACWSRPLMSPNWTAVNWPFCCSPRCLLAVLSTIAGVMLNAPSKHVTQFLKAFASFLFRYKPESPWIL